MSTETSPRWETKAPPRPPIRTIVRAGAMATVGMLALVGLGELTGHLLLLAPMAATMALIAAAPQLPLSQPRTVLIGHVISAVVGLGIGLLSHSLWAGAIAGGLALAAMMWARSSHSPGVATAVIAAMTTTGHFEFFLGVVVAAVILVALGVIRSRLLGVNYPQYWW